MPPLIFVQIRSSACTELQWLAPFSNLMPARQAESIDRSIGNNTGCTFGHRGTRSFLSSELFVILSLCCGSSKILLPNAHNLACELCDPIVVRLLTYSRCVCIYVAVWSLTAAKAHIVTLHSATTCRLRLHIAVKGSNKATLLCTCSQEQAGFTFQPPACPVSTTSTVTYALR